jgi:nucleotide-binding universal stress UspA family protein
MHSPPGTQVRSGVPGRAVVEAAAEQEASLLVLGPHERGGPRERITTAFGGTVAVRALAARVCPVLVVREPPRHAYRRVLLALDLSPNATDVVHAAESLVLDSRADASVLHAHDTPYLGSVEHADAGRGMSARYSALWRSHATVTVRSLLRRSSRDFSRYGIQIDDAPPARAILDAMKQQEPDLVVMGTSGRGPVGRAFLGSVANQVLNDGWCDVLVVPQGALNRRAAVGPRDRAASETAHRYTQPDLIPLHRRQ